MGNLWYYTSTWREDGKYKSKNFSIKKLGKEVALDLAIKYRKEKT